jgi:toxin ParE1/3/4
MTRTIVIRPKASLDLDDCFIFIAQNNEDAATRFFDSVRQTYANLARMPRMGTVYHATSDQNSDLRKWPVKGFRGYLIFYRVHETEIEIVRVLPAARNIDQILESDLN